MVQPALAFTQPNLLKEKAHALHLAQDPYWRRLLHYSHNLLGIYESEIDDPSFFASPRGRRDAQAELDATLDAFFAPTPAGADAQQGQCRYPARLVWLKEK